MQLHDGVQLLARVPELPKRFYAVHRPSVDFTGAKSAVLSGKKKCRGTLQNQGEQAIHVASP